MRKRQRLHRFEIFGWMQSRLNPRAGSKKLSAVRAPHHAVQEHEPNCKEEFSDWPQGLLAIGTFGRSGLKQDSEERDVQETLSSDFTPEEVGILKNELTKLLLRKQVSNEPDPTDGETADLPLDRFLNCPSSLEIDRRNYNGFCDTDSEDKSCNLQPNASVVLSKNKEVCLDNASNVLRKRSLSFLLKKMFVCKGGFAPVPSLRDPIPETRMEKLLRAIIHKKIYPQSSTPRSSMKKYLENREMPLKAGNEDERQDKSNDGCKWVKTDSEYIVLEI